MNLQSDDFELFGVPRRFAQDAAVLDARWKELQREAHPDRFSSQGPAAQRAAMQWSVRINEAYNRLRDPLRRAAYLCELAGASINAHSNTAMPAAFLMQQMQWREALEEAADSESLEALADRVARSRREALASCGEAIDTACDFPLAVEQVRSLMFIERFAAELDARIDAVQDAAGAWGRGQ
jgi:molecular chaperone HscB